MVPPGDRTRPENHPYIDLHEQHPHERDVKLDSSAENPFWYPPDDVDSTDTVWRYMDLAKFISILQTRSVWFSHHSNFDDPYEGRYSEFTAENIRSEYDELGLSIPDSLSEDSTIGYENYVSCWNLNNDQSVALWNMYIDGENGVAIKSTIGDLESSVGTPVDSPYDYNYISGKVVYRSEEKEPRGFYAPIFTKRPIYSFETEYRMIFTSTESQYVGSDENHSKLPTNGVSVSVDIEELIDDVYISPSAGGYVKNVVENLTENFDFNVQKSSLFSNPQVGDE